MLIAIFMIIGFTTGSLLTLKAYKQGLTHAFDLRQDRPPTEFKNPIAKIIDVKKDIKDKKEADDVINEYLHDPRDD